MTRQTQGLVLCLLGALVLKLVLEGAHLRYVNDWLTWPLVVSGVLLLLIALVGTLRPGGAGEHDGHGHADPLDAQDPHDPRDDDAPGAEDAGTAGHAAHGVPVATWLLLAPVVVVFAISPPPLGSFLTERQANEIAPPAVAAMPALAPGDPLEMSVEQFVVYAGFDEGRQLAGREVVLEGFVTRTEDGWAVSRIGINCCAADAYALEVQVAGYGGEVPPRDSWVRVTGTWVEPPPGDLPPPDQVDPVVAVLDDTAVVPIPEPRNPYG